MPRVGWVAIGAAGGAVLGGSSPPATLLCALALLLVGFALDLAASLPVAPRRQRTGRRVRTGGLTRYGGSTVLSSLGVVLVLGRLALAGPPEPPPGVLPAGSGPWEAVVETIGTPRQGQQAATIVLENAAGAAAGRDAATGAAARPIRLTATLPRYPDVAPGDRIELRGSLRVAADDDFGASLRARGIAGTIRSPEMRLLPAPAGPARLVESIRRGAAEALARVLPEPEAGLAAGILIGLRDRVDRDVAAAFTTAGVSHVVAISGWNIAIVGAVVALLLKRWPRRRRALATVAVVATYTVLAGASSSVVRAALMAGVVLVARESGRAGRAASALAWAVLVMLVVDPAIVADAGFSLSVLATAGLLAWGSGLTSWFARLGRDRFVPGWIAENLGVSLAAQAWTLPVVLASFGRLALTAPLVNLVVVPLVAPAMAAGAVALVGGFVAAAGVPALGTMLALPAWILLGSMIRLVELGAGLPLASVTLEPPADTIAAAVAGLLLLAAILGCRRIVRAVAGRTTHAAVPGVGGMVGGKPPGTGTHRRIAVGVLTVVAIAVPLAATSGPGGGVRLVVLDVGQGDAILVENAGSRILVDGGPDPDRLLGLLDRRFPPWDRRLDLVVLTHPHEDHVAGLPLVLRRYRVARVAEPGMPGAGPGYAEWRSLLDDGSIPVEHLATGDALVLDDLELTVLWPDAGHVPTKASDDGARVNGSSIVLLGQVGERRFLLTGDAEEDIDPYLLARGLPPIDVLKVAHHGSPTSSSAPLLDRLRTAVAIISVGARNTYGHPGRATLSRLAAAGAHVLRTDRNGTVEVRIDRVGVSVSADRDDAAAAGSPVTARATSGGATQPRDLPAPQPDGGLTLRGLLYHRPDGRSHARRGRIAAALSGASAVAPSSLPRRRGGRRLPRGACRRARARPPPQ